MARKSEALEEAVGRFFREIVNSNGYGGDIYEEIVHEMHAGLLELDPEAKTVPDPEVPPAQAAPVPEESEGAEKGG